MDDTPKQAECAVQSKDEVCEAHGEFTSSRLRVYGETFIWTKCPSCVREQDLADEQKRAKADAEKRQKALEEKLRLSGIPERFKDRTIEGYIAETEDQKMAKAIAMEFLADIRSHMAKGTQVVFSGTIGTGKSHLAIAILRQAMARYSGIYINASDMIRRVRDTWRGGGSGKSETEVLEMFGRIDLLVIDEVGAQYGTEGEQLIIFDVLNRRYTDVKPTIILTNMGSKSFEEYVGPRTFDRIKECGIWVRFKWESHRGKKSLTL